MLDRPLNSQSLWGSEHCPFELAPRWLTSPSDVSVNLRSANLAQALMTKPARPLALRQTVKQFGTVKVNYFCDYYILETSWEPIEAHWSCRQSDYISSPFSQVQPCMHFVHNQGTLEIVSQSRLFRHSLDSELKCAAMCYSDHRIHL